MSVYLIVPLTKKPLFRSHQFLFVQILKDFELNELLLLLQMDPSKSKRKFSSFFKSLVIELDKDLYGPDNHLVEWRRTPTTQETDGFQVKRPGEEESWLSNFKLQTEESRDMSITLTNS